MIIFNRQLKRVMAAFVAVFIMPVSAMHVLDEEHDKEQTEEVNIVVTQKAKNKRLLDAVHRGSEEMVGVALEEGADVNGQDIYGNTPLMLAALKNYGSFAQVLLDKKAAVNRRNVGGETALIDACGRGHSSLAALLLAYNADINVLDGKKKWPFYSACAGDYTETVLMLLEHKAAIDNKDKEIRTTPLMKAVGNGNKRVVQALLEHKAEVNVTNKKGKTAFIMAHEGGYKEIQNMLLATGADSAGVDNAASVAFQRATDAQRKIWIEIQKRRTPFVPKWLPVRRIHVIKQKKGDCALHVLANAASINECLRQGQILSSDCIKEYSKRFYDQGALALEHVEGITNIQSMSLAKSVFMMNNMCAIASYVSVCFTTTQSIEQLSSGIMDEHGPVFNNKSIHAMFDKFNQSDYGAVHFDCCIPVKSYTIPVFKLEDEYHGVLVSFVKERHKERPYIVYIDSNNLSLKYVPEVQCIIDRLREMYGKNVSF